MFDDLDQVDWKALNTPEAPEWIRGLVSGDDVVRNDSFDALLDAYIYDRPTYAQYVVIYMLRILEQGEVNTESELLITFLRNMRTQAKYFLADEIGVEVCKSIVSNIDQSVEVFKKLAENPLTKDAALEILADIENRPL